MLQFHAGYVIEELVPLLEQAAAAGCDTPTAKEQVRSLLKELSYFELSGLPEYLPAPSVEVPGAVRVASNLISRGLPTRAPLSLVGHLRGLWPTAGLDTEEAKKGTIKLALGPPDVNRNRLLWRALHLADARLRTDDKAAVERWPLGSDAEHRFLTEVLPAQFGKNSALLWQLLEPQATFRPLLEAATGQPGQPGSYLRQPAVGFTGQSLDFALPLPYRARASRVAETGLCGLIVEVDGSQHRLPAQFRHDGERDAAARKAGWQTVRLPTAHFARPATDLNLLHKVVDQHPYWQLLKENYTDRLTDSPEGQRALQLMLTPLAVARVQRTLLACIDNGLLGWEQPSWRLSIIERDVPCAHLAVAGLRELLTDLLDLEGAGRQVPRIDLYVFGTPEFADAELRYLPEHPVRLLEEGQPPAGPAPDILLDISMLQRPGFSAAPQTWPAAVRLTVRSSHRAHAPRRFLTGPLIKYQPLVQEQDRADEYEYPVLAGRVAPLRRLLWSLFRKFDFRPGQLPILSRALQGKSVLGLLPTGGGKSLTYQLAALLQPGVTLVVDPIKSLMQDQYEGLLANWIDAVAFINSAVAGGRAGREHRVTQLERGELLLTFVSPERLVIKGFRDALERMQQPESRVGFAYCIIDEAHCVSEWGHDFRTHYLHLGRNARRFCHTHDGQPVPLYALTATASFDVLADVERELALQGEPDAVIRFASNRRHELDFRVIAAPTDQQDPGPAKHQALVELLRQLPAELQAFDKQEITETDAQGKPLAKRPALPDFTPASFYEPNADSSPLFFAHAGLIFCPHRSKSYSGVSQVLAEVRKLPEFRERTGFFMAPDGKFSQADQEKENKQLAETQQQFVQSRLNLLVATKAFGMGIDKPNVRFTIHYSHPGSIESFIQETGRAGRDRRSALNYVLFHPSDQKIQEEFHQGNFKGADKEYALVQELLTEVTFPTWQTCVQLTADLVKITNLEISSLRVVKPRLLSNGIRGPLTIFVNRAAHELYGSLYFDPEQGWLISDEFEPECITETTACEAVLTSLHKLLEQQRRAVGVAPTEAALQAWLTQPTPGILARLAAVAVGQRPAPLIIGFSNDALSRMDDILTHHKRPLPQYVTSLSTTAGYANSGEEFVRDLGQQPKTDYGKELAAQWLRYRDDQSTMKAVHRLATLGVIEDYTVDYNAGLLTLILAPKPDNEQDYLGRLEKYLLRYTTRQRASELTQAAIRRPEGKTLLEKCLGVMLEFSYSTVAEKRLAAIKEMHGALINYGLDKNPSMSLTHFCDLYLNSKYAHVDFLPKDTKNGSLDSADNLWKYLDHMGAPPDKQGEVQDNVKHLRGACARMLPSYPDNATLKLLDGFAILFLENHKPAQARPDPVARTAGEEKILAGLLGFGKRPEYADPTALAELAHHFADETGRYDEQAAAYVREVAETIVLRPHLAWLRAFNDRYDNRPN